MGSLRSVLLMTSACLLAAACVDTKEVFVERDLYSQPPTAAQGFLGYNDIDGKVPVCGSCHVGVYAEWKDTHHANAWQDLQDTGHASEHCEACHTVGGNGNSSDNPAGWVATADDRYLDVQCEACHGPGLLHVTNPDATQPYASVLVGVDLSSGCGECHQGTHHGFVDEWAQSRHANTTNHAQTNPECGPCHEARGIFEAWGIDAPYIEKDQTDVIPIVCAVCHDPHSRKNDHQLRWPISTPNVETQLCMKCHHRRAEPDPTSSRGPHSPQGPLLLGEAGWRPPDFLSPTTKIVATHGTEANPELCATCHVHRMTVTDDATGDFVFQSTGHLFQAIPCLNEQGLPTTEECEVDQRSFEACTASGCHGSGDAARSAFIVATQRIQNLADQLNALLDQVPESEFEVNDDLITTAEGAKFNAGFAGFDGSPVHNPFLVEALITASIKQVQQEYGVQAPPSLVLDNILGRPR